MQLHIWGRWVFLLQIFCSNYLCQNILVQNRLPQENFKLKKKRSIYICFFYVQSQHSLYEFWEGEKLSNMKTMISDVVVIWTGKKTDPNTRFYAMKVIIKKQWSTSLTVTVYTLQWNSVLNLNTGFNIGMTQGLKIHVKIHKIQTNKQINK